MNEKRSSVSILRAVADHAENHGLQEHLSHVGSIRFDHAAISLFEHPGESAIAALLPWATSIGAHLVKTVLHAGQYQLTVSGLLDDGTPAAVTAITRTPETDSLTAAGVAESMSLDELAGHVRRGGDES